MKKLISLIKATILENNSLFKFKKTEIKNSFMKILLPVFLFIFIMICLGGYSFMMADSLSKVGLTFIILTIYILGTTILTIVEGSYKSQGILFECKDNDLLMSMPIKKSYILTSRIIKLIYFQFLFDLLFMVPAMFTYAWFEHPGASFYFVSLLMLILLPIIPTVLASIFGTIIKAISSLFKNKKTFQTILSILFTFVLMIFCFSTNNIINMIVENASSINDVICKIYYPAGLYVNLITNFNLLDLIKLIVINLGIFALFIYIISKSYYRIIFRLSGNVKHKSKKYEYQFHLPMRAMINKELKRYFSSPIYVMNTLFGVVMIFIAVIVLAISPDKIFNLLVSNTNGEISIEYIKNALPMIYLIAIVFSLSLTSITCSSISLEGSSINLTKSLPISIKNIFLAKIYSSLIIVYPLTFLGNIIFIFTFKIDFIFSIIIFLVSILIPIMEGFFGLIVNLKYPKMKFSNDTEVVKQSMATMIGVYTGMILTAIFAVGVFVLSKYINSNIIIFGEILLIVILILILKKLLFNKGVKQFIEINV